MTKLFKDATAGELHEMAKGLRAHLVEALGYVEASVCFEIEHGKAEIVIRCTDDSKGNLYKGVGVEFIYCNLSLDGSLDGEVAKAWVEVNDLEPADKRHIRSLMAHMGSELEMSEAFKSASAEAFRERIRAMRDDMGARLIEGPKS